MCSMGRWLGMAVLVGILGMNMPLWAADSKPAAPPAANTPGSAAAITEKKATTAEYLAQADKAIQEKKYSEALSTYLLAWLGEPDNPLILDKIGNVYVLTGRLPESTKFFAVAIKMKPDYEPAILDLANTYLQLNFPGQAVILLSDMPRLTHFEKSPAYVHLLGIACQRDIKTKGRLAQSIVALREAAKLAPNNGAFHGDLANSYFLSGDYQKADDEYAQALTRSPNDAVAALNRSKAQERLGKILEAITSLNQYLQQANPPADDAQRKRLESLKSKLAQGGAGK